MDFFVKAFLAAGILVGLTACEGFISEPLPSQIVDPNGCDAASAGPAPPRLLTQREYNNTLADLLGAGPLLRISPSAGAAGIFDNDVRSLGVPSNVAEAYLTASEQASALAVTQFDSLAGCNRAEAGDDACVRKFVREFGRRVFRRPVEEGEATTLFALFELGRQREGFDAGLGYLVQGMLQSPHFLYRLDLGTGVVDPTAPERTPLSAYELASRLSYFIMGTTPSDALLDTARDGGLDTHEQVAAVTRALMSEPGARESAAWFHAQWLEINAVEEIFKAAPFLMSEELRRDLAQETQIFLEDLIWERRGSINDIFAANHSLMNERVAAHYGYSQVSGETFQTVALGPERTGVLTHAGFLAAQAMASRTSPVKRGVFVMERLLCVDAGTPPADVPSLEDALEPEEPAPASLDVPELLARHRADPSCASCHDTIDPIGLGFEHYDAVGRWRDDDDGRPIAATGEFVRLPELTGTFGGATGLAEKLAASDVARLCVARQWLRFGLGRPEVQKDVCAMKDVLSEISDGGYRLDDLVVAIAASDVFRYRHSLEPQETCP